MKIRIVAALSALALTGALVAPAQATLLISGSFDGGAAVFAIDNDATSTCGAIAVGCQLPDLDPTVGVLTLGPTNAGTGGTLNIQGSVQTSDAGAVNRLDSTGTQVTNTGLTAHSFVVAISDINFEGPVLEATTTGAGQWSHLGGGYGDTSITMAWYNDPANGQGAESPFDTPGNQIDLFAATPNGLGGANPQSFSHTGGPFAVNDPDLFSMTLQFSGVLDAGVRLTGREMTEIKPQEVPLPAALMLVGIGLLAMPVLRRGDRPSKS
jgi:hypothetical protein